MSLRTTPPQACIVCGIPPRVTFRLSNGAWLKRCPRCLLGWWDWPPFDPAEFYDRSYFQSGQASKGYGDYAATETGQRRTGRGRLRRIARHLVPTPRKAAKHPPFSPGAFAPLREPRIGQVAASGGLRPALLEIGCGTGVFLDVARETGWQVSGIEVSSYAVQQARGRGLSVDVCPIESSPLRAATYDCIALWDVIEHLRDPAGVLIQAGRALRPGGVLALSTGDVTSLSARLSGPGWHLFTVPEHLYFFSPAALEQLLRRAGCRIVQTTREVIWVPVAYLLERLRKIRVLPERVAGPLVRGLSRAGASHRVVPATLLDVLGVYARRI